jgi:hypothetical protein
MMRIISLLLLLIPAALGAKYDGMFKLTEAYQDDHLVTIPPGKSFTMMLRSEDESHYAISLRLGNSLRSKMSVVSSEDGKDSLHMGDVMSTMMMPPEDVFRVEQFLTSNLPKMTSIYFSDNDEKLIMEGEAKVVFTRE